MTIEELLEMELHEQVEIPEEGLKIIRIINGWLYIVTDVLIDESRPVFVPEKL